MAVWLPWLATDRLRRRAAAPEAARAPGRVTAAGERGALRLAAVDAAAAALGLAPGMMLADARAMVPGLAVARAEPARDAECLGRLADWCLRYTPWTAVDGGDGIWLDITGCAHLFGGEAALIGDVVDRLTRLGFAARAAIADTPGAAWALSRCGASGRAIVPPGAIEPALRPLPVAALRLPAAAVETLDRLGLRRIADLDGLPRAGLVQRFGAVIAARLDQALGRLAEPVSPRRPVAPHRARLAFAEPILRPEDIAAVAARLLQELAQRLTALALGARRLELTLFRADGTLARAAIGTSRPARDAAALARLFAEPLQGVDPGFGIEAATLDALAVEPLLPAQAAFRQLCPAPDGDGFEAADLAPLIDRLGNRLGPQAVASLAARASHLPERAVARRPALADFGRPWPPAPERDAWTAAPARPLRLLPRPEPIEAVAPVPDDPPVLFRWRRVLHRVARADGPERIAPEWWRHAAHLTLPVADATGPLPLRPEGRRGPLGASDLRDYYRVEDRDGRRFWLYRDGLYRPEAPPRWYLHGLFA